MISALLVVVCSFYSIHIVAEIEYYKKQFSKDDFKNKSICSTGF